MRRAPMQRETAEKRQRLSCQGFALAKTVVPDGRVLLPHVLVQNGNTEQRSGGYGASGAEASEEPNVAVIDEAADSVMPASLTVRGAGRSRGQSECLLPRAAAIDPARGTLLVACVGIDALVEYDGASAEPVTNPLRRWQVASGPTGVAVDWGGRRALVWSQFDRVLNLIDLDAKDGDPSGSSTREPAMRLALSRRPAPPETADLALGRKLFHASCEARTSSDGRACASCHPDGRDDSITWTTPDGPRQTPMLAGRLEGTAPYSWSGSGETIQAHLTHTFQRLSGVGLQSHELDSLVAYIRQMTPPPTGSSAQADKQLARGAQIFHSAEAECSSCHGKGGAAPDGLKHDVDSRARADAESEFDTPSLRFVGGSGPWFHDGRYTSLRALLVENDGKMGKISHLSPSDLDALEAYVRSL